MYRIVIVLAYWSEYIRCTQGVDYIKIVEVFKRNNFAFERYIYHTNYSILVTTCPGGQLHVLQKNIKICD